MPSSLRSVALSLFLPLFLFGCASSQGQPTPRVAAAATNASDPDAMRAAIATVLDDWHDAAAHADEARYFGHFAPGGVFLGTDATERWELDAFRAYSHPHFAKGKAWTFHPRDRHVTLGPAPHPAIGARTAPDLAIAWFDEALESNHLGLARGSGVLVLDPKTGIWKIAQYNLSVPIPNERFQDVKRVIAEPHTDSH